MSGLFVKSEWGGRRPEPVKKTPSGKLVVSRNVEAVERDGETVYVGECAIMSEQAYAAYSGAVEVAQRREQEIVDETVLNLIEEGSL